MWKRFYCAYWGYTIPAFGKGVVWQELLRTLRERILFAWNQFPLSFKEPFLLGPSFQTLTRHRTTDWFKTGKGVCQSCRSSLYLFNLHAEYIMRNPGLDESQARIKIFRRNVNHLRYADDTTLMAENEEELKSPLMKVQEESEKFDLKLNIQKTKIRHPVPWLHGK